MNIFLKILKNERNVTNFGYVFVMRFRITHTNIPWDWTNSCPFIGSIFFQKRCFQKRKKNWKSSYESWKINKFISNEKKDKLPDYLLNKFFSPVNNFSALLLYKIDFLTPLIRVIFFRFWFYHEVTKFCSNFTKFCLGMYVSYILDTSIIVGIHRTHFVAVIVGGGQTTVLR